MRVLNENDIYVKADKAEQIRFNLKEGFGFIMSGDQKYSNILDATKDNAIFGKTVDLALCWTCNKILTFGEFYENEPFVEIYGIPVGGELKDSYPTNASKLIQTLLRGHSKDNFTKLFDKLVNLAFKEWTYDCDFEDFVKVKISDYFASKIFSFTINTYKGVNSYFAVDVNFRDPVDNEIDYLIIANTLYKEMLAGSSVCTVPHIEEIHQKCLVSLSNQMNVGLLPAA